MEAADWRELSSARIKKGIATAQEENVTSNFDLMRWHIGHVYDTIG